MENSLSDKIDSYLDGKMNAEEKAAFEKELSSNNVLRQQVETQKNLRAGIDRMNMKANISSTFRKITLTNKIYKWGIATVAVAAIGSAAYFGFKSMNANGADKYVLPVLNEQGKAEWADADRNLPTQTFAINPDKDTVVETDGGIVFAIPAGAFLDAKAPVTLEVREALTPMDIMKGGLSTTSDGKLLETAGMFYLNARSGDVSLKINPAKPIYVNVPTNEVKPGMMVFDGERKSDGSINWVNPKQPEKQLIPVDIHSLDFYPKGFREKVAELGFDANNKKVTDSIYYSYAGRENPPLENSTSYYSDDRDELNKAVDTSKIRIVLVSYKGALEADPEINRSKTDAKKIWDTISSDLGNPEKRKDNYYNNKFNEEPKSSGWLKKKNELITTFINDSKTSIGHLETEASWCDYGFYNVYYRSIPKQLATNGTSLEINPARISAFWNDKFQNTLIATKEFEERLQVIFKYGRPNILDLYVNNLNKKMYEIDSMAMTLSGDNVDPKEVSDADPISAPMPEFRQFYLRHDGGVSIQQSHMKELQNYFNLKRKAVEMASQKTYDALKEKQNTEDANYSNTKSQQTTDDAKRNADNYNKEFDINLTEACRQLGCKHTYVASDYYAASITTTGWKNLDMYVAEATLNRTTLDYTDPQSGKKAIIKYEPFSVDIADFKNYDQVTVYLVPDSLNSFMKVNGSDGSYSEKLNELMKYDLIIMAKKGNDWAWAQRNNIKPGKIDLQLEAIEETQLKANITAAFSSNTSSDLEKEIHVMQEEHDYKIQMKQREAQDKIDSEIMPVIFPFWQAAQGGAQATPSDMNAH